MKEKIRCGETHYGDSPYRSDVHGILLHGSIYGTSRTGFVRYVARK